MTLVVNLNEGGMKKNSGTCWYDMSCHTSMTLFVLFLFLFFSVFLLTNDMAQVFFPTRVQFISHFHSFIFIAQYHKSHILTQSACTTFFSFPSSLMSFLFFRANLSDSYFTNRQDRYVLLENCSEVADFFSDLVEAVGDVSLQLQPDDSVTMLEGMVHPYKGKPSNAGVCVHRGMFTLSVLTLFDTSCSVSVTLSWFSARGADGFLLMELKSLDRQIDDGQRVGVFVCECVCVQ